MLKIRPLDGIDVADNNAVYYYHYDGLGSVVALSDSYGDSCQSYEYSAYGQVAASDPNFTANPYMFTGRRFDYETGLYYYRARYYNPYIGRFLQTDPIGYGDGINWYAYCGNNPLNFVDPSGTYQMITGDWMVCAEGVDPNTQRYVNHAREAIKDAINVITDVIPGAPDLSIPIEILERGYNELGRKKEGRWRAFLMVIDCNDKNGNQKIDADEFIGDPYFIEIKYIGAGYATEESDATYDKANGWQGVGKYYPTSYAAQDAIGTAMELARMSPDEWEKYPGTKYPNIQGVIPENWKVLQPWLTDGAGDPYGTRKYTIELD